jgi:hypothetical protein
VTAPADMWAAALARITAGLTTLAQQWETAAADTRTCPRHLAAPPQPCKHCAGTGEPATGRYGAGAADAYRTCAAQVRELLAGPA